MEMNKKEYHKELLTVKDLASILIISKRTIYNGVSNGTFPLRPIRIGRRLLRWRRRDVEKYLESL